MRSSKFVVACGLLFGLLLTAESQAQSSLEVLTVDVEQVPTTGKTVFNIFGVNFGNTKPLVYLGGTTLKVTTFEPQSIQAEPLFFSPGPGIYRLEVVSGADSTHRDEFEVVLGNQGPKGDKGDVGVTGPKGDQGIQGEMGDKGERGERGLTGPTGLTGSTGPMGAMGATGATGPVGPPGPTRSVFCRDTGTGGVNTYDLWVSMVGCSAGEFLTGGSCYTANKTMGTASGVGFHNGQFVYTCALRGPASTTATVITNAVCCRYQ